MYNYVLGIKPIVMTPWTYGFKNMMSWMNFSIEEVTLLKFEAALTSFQPLQTHMVPGFTWFATQNVVALMHTTTILVSMNVVFVGIFQSYK